jgi:hypothetical protein
MAAELENFEDQHEWTFSDHRVTQFCVEMTSCRLQSWSLQESIEVRFASPFELTLADGSTRRIDPTAHEQLAPLLTLVGRALVQLVVSRSGDLELRLSDGTVIEMRTRATRASFEVNGAGALEGMTYISGTAGGPLW